MDASLVGPANIIGKVVFSIPHLGNIANYIQNPPGIYIAIAVSIGLIVIVFITDNVTSKDGEKVLPALFETFQVTATVDNEGLKAFANMEMQVEGHAIQTAALADENAAWAAFDGQMN